jgi:hypothetical protein
MGLSDRRFNDIMRITAVVCLSKGRERRRATESSQNFHLKYQPLDQITWTVGVSCSIQIAYEQLILCSSS